MKKNIFIKLFLISLIISFNNILYSQTINTQINSYLKLIAEGKIQEVKSKIIKLSDDYPDEPGVLLLQGDIQKNIEKALPLYKRILSKYPNSEWADDAALRIIQYNSIIGDTIEAIKELSYFRTKYKNSPFLELATIAVQMAISKEQYKLQPKTKQIEKALTTQTKTKIVSTKQHYGLQVGLYSSLKSAEAEKEKFIKLKLRTEVKEKIVNGEKHYAVIIGNYSSEETALEAKKIVAEQCNCTPILYKK